MKVPSGDDSLLVDISDALSERDRVRFTVHTRTKLPQFAKPVLSVVRQHEEFIWLHDCLEDNDQYAGYIIPPPPPKPDFDSSREKLQRLGDGEASMTKEEFAKVKQELEAEYLAIFKKTVAMHEIFLQRLAAHEIFRQDNNFKIFLEYENELAVRGKSKKEKIAGSIQNIGKSLSDFVIATSQVAATTSASTSILAGTSQNRYPANSNNSNSIVTNTSRQVSASNSANNSDDKENGNANNNSSGDNEHSDSEQKFKFSTANNNNTGDGLNDNRADNIQSSLATHEKSTSNDNNTNTDDIDEQYFEKERLFLALYYNSIKETAIQADRVSQAHKLVADSYLHIAQQLVKLASIEVVPITAQTKDSSRYVACPLPSLTLPNAPPTSATNLNNTSSSSSGVSSGDQQMAASSSSSNYTSGASNARNLELADSERDDDLSNDPSKSSSKNSNSVNDGKQRDKSSSVVNTNDVGGSAAKSTGGCANDHTSEGLKQLLLHVSDYLEQARKIETRIASDEDLKLTDTFLYYKRDTQAAQDLLSRRLRFMAEYENASKNLEKARQKGRTQMQYADVIERQAKENFISISRLAKQELVDYKQRRVVSFRKAFEDLVELEMKHLRSHRQMISNCLNVCQGRGNTNCANVSK